MAPLGNLVRLQPLDINELPAHPSLDSLLQSPERASESTSPSQATTIASTERPNLVSFIEEVLEQATLFVDDTLPITFKEGALKSSSPSEARVRLLSRDIGVAEIRSVPWINSCIPRNWSSNRSMCPEAWFARRSRHANRRSHGTADFGEFDFGLRHDHSKHEQDYTPDIFDSFKVLDWDEQIESATDNGAGIDGYRDLSMSIFEMCHQLPAMLSNRVFSVLVVTAKRGKDSFIVVQIPVDISNLTAAFYSNGRNLKEGSGALKRQKPVLGIYTSIESCRLLPDQEVEWVMATASDAKGWLPMWMQKLGIPSAVVKDVGSFTEWIGKTRNAAE